ncbi:MAG: dTDP-glucose 4,6-dehydratase [Patescibacteria group bacterium]|jgi:dTDP-glucose 4,6-dehydratase
MKILLTGGAGFMGSNAIRYFLKHRPDIEIVNLDKLTYAGNLANLKDLEDDPRYRFVQGDIANEIAVEEVFATHQFDAVINYAAETHVDRSILDPDAFIFTDVIGTYRLLEAVKRHKVPRFIQISTDEVYGAVPKGETDEEAAFRPSSPYSASKAGADHLIEAYIKTFEVPAIITHSCNFFGPYQYPEKLIPLFITNLLEDKKVPVYGDGKQVREWIYTEDHCHAILTILEKGELGQTYNIGTGERINNIEFTQKLLELLELGEDMIEHVKDRPAHDVRYAIDSGKLRKKLDWKPDVSFEEGVKRTVEWYKANEDWWKPIKTGAYLDYYKQQYEQR